MTIINPMQLQRKCNSCGGLKTLTVPTMAYEKWKAGEGYVQDLFPMLSAGDRELLISGTCEPCFDAMFLDPDEDVDDEIMQTVWDEELLNEERDLPEDNEFEDDIFETGIKDDS